MSAWCFDVIKGKDMTSAATVAAQLLAETQDQALQPADLECLGHHEDVEAAGRFKRRFKRGHMEMEIYEGTFSLQARTR